MESKPVVDTRSRRGLLAALAVIAAWSALLAALLGSDLGGRTALASPLLVVCMTFLYTGLFITAHDAMHGLVAPWNKTLNDAVGWFCTLVFALFPFTRLRTKHHEHHRMPAGPEDPDFHDGTHRGFWPWYARFFFTYVSWPQILGMAVVFNVLHHLAGIPLANLILFWVIPSLLSTVQLFFFGTYLPHRELEAPYTDRHRARSNDYSTLLSFLTCYHFGYHWEHHAYPYVPWWALPAVRRGRFAAGGS